MKKHLITIAVMVSSLTPLSAQAQAQAQETMTDARFVAATRCIAYADHRALTSDAPNVDALRQAVRYHDGRADPVAIARADEVKRDVRRERARDEAETAALREARDRACASFVTQGLVQAGAGNSAS